MLHTKSVSSCKALFYVFCIVSLKIFFHPLEEKHVYLKSAFISMHNPEGDSTIYGERVISRRQPYFCLSD